MSELDQGIRLTETVKKGGCAAKLPAKELGPLLSRLQIQKPAELLVGNETLDDACLWDLGNGELLIQTLDFFTPIVNDAYEFGQIAAANSISDVYAMGGHPKIALSIMAYPAQTLPLELARPMMEGAVSKIEEAGACLAGGHTIDDETLKLGFAVTGFVNKGREWKNSGAQVGDSLILTKPLGTGTITSAIKQNSASFECARAAIESMKQLNNAVELLSEIPVHAATDVTGFGLAGHAWQMAKASQVSMKIVTQSIPSLHGALDLLREGVLNRAHRTNLDYVKDHVRFHLAKELQWLCVDPQTSGGLLLSIPSDFKQNALSVLNSRFPAACVIGEIVKSYGEHLVEFC